MALVQADKVAADGVGFPQHAVVVDQDRDLGVGVQGEELGGLRGLEADAPVFTHVVDTQFLAGPQHFAHVDGGGAAQDFQ